VDTATAGGHGITLDAAVGVGAGGGSDVAAITRHVESEPLQPSTLSTESEDVIVVLLVAAERILAWTRTQVDQSLCQMQLRVRHLRVQRDPKTGQWLDQTRRALKDGTLQEAAHRDSR